MSQEFVQEKVYLDYNATTPLDPQVIEAVTSAMINNWSNPSSQYAKSKQTKSLINESRQSVADMINATSSSDIIFVSGGTEANNMVFFTVLNDYKSISMNKKPHFIISSIEHDSVKLIAEDLERHGLAELTEVNVNEYGQVNASDVISAIRPNTILISIMLANNETGIIQPVEDIAKMLKEHGYNSDHIGQSQRIYLHTDAAQAIGKIKVDVTELDVDYLTIVGHKFYAPRIGALYVRNCFSNNPIDSYNKAPLVPIFFGGGQENGLRPGTENTPMIAGLGKAAELVNNNLGAFQTNMKSVRDYLERRLEEEFGKANVHFNGRTAKAKRLPNTCNASFIADEKFKGYHIIAQAKIFEASTGASCHSGKKSASKILLAMGIPIDVASNAVRFSIGRETTEFQIDFMINDLKEVLNKLKNE